MQRAKLFGFILFILLLTPMLSLPDFSLPEVTAVKTPDVVLLPDVESNMITSTIVTYPKPPIDWEKVWEGFNEYVTWTCTPFNEDLEVLVEYPQQDKAKITLILTASQTANYVVTFDIGFLLSDLDEAEIEDGKVKLKYDNYELEFEWKDILDQELEVSYVTENYFSLTFNTDMNEGDILYIDPTISILDTISLFDGWWITQRHTYTDGSRYYYFWTTTGGGSRPFYVSYSEDGVTWTQQQVGATVDAVGWSVWGNSTHVGIVVTTNQGDVIMFWLYGVNTDGSLDLQTNSVVILEAVIGHKNVNICQDNDGYWWVVYTYTFGEAYAFKYQKSTDVNGTAWTATAAVLNGGYAGSVMPIGDDVVFMYGLNGDNDLLSKVRFANNTWGSELIIDAESYNPNTQHSAIVDENGYVQILSRPNIATGARRYYLENSSTAWVYIDNADGYYGSLSIEPSNEDFYFTHNSASDYIKMQNNTYLDGDWTAIWNPWGNRNDGIYTNILANRLLRSGKYVAAGYNESGPNFNALAFTMDLPIEHIIQSVNISDLTCTTYMEEGGTYTFNVTAKIEDLNNVTELEIWFIDNSDNYVTVVFDGDSWSLTSDIATLESPQGYGYDHDIDRGYFWFTITILPEATDKRAVSLYTYVLLEDDFSQYYTFSSAFSIYVSGGFVDTIYSGTAGRTTGGSLFEIYAENNSYAFVNQSWNRMQAYTTLFGIKAPKISVDQYESDDIYIETGIYYCYGSTWLEGWKVRIENYESWILKDSRIHCTWNLSWYWRGEYVKEDIVQSFFYWGNATADSNPGVAVLIVDLWFGVENAGSVGRGRVTAQYFGMEDGAHPLVKWVETHWGPTWTNVTQSMFTHDLTDPDGNVIPSTEITMIKHFFKVYQGANEHDYRWELTDFDLESRIHHPTRLEGADTPIFISTKVISMPQTGFLPALASAWSGFSLWIIDGFSGIGNFIATSAQNLYMWLMPFLTSAWDTFWTFLSGLPYIGQVFVWIADAFAWMVTAVTNMLAMIVASFEFFINVITFPITIFVTVLGYLGDMWNGTGYFVGLPMSQFLVLASMSFVFYLVLEMGKGNVTPLLDSMRIIWSVFSTLFDLGMRLLEFVADRLIGGLPI